MKQHWIIIFQGFSFAFLFGLIIGMLIFITPSELCNWWKGIDWHGQGVANAGAWVSGLATIPAAIFTGYSAFAASRAAKAAEASASQWRDQTTYDNLIDKAIHTKIHIKWIKSHLKNAFGRDSRSRFLCLQRKSTKEFFDDLFEALHNGWDDDYAEMFMNMDLQLQKVDGRAEDFFITLDYTIELSKSITACSNEDYLLVKERSEHIVSALPFVRKILLKIKNADSDDFLNDSKENILINIDSIFLTKNSSQYYIREIINDIWLINKYIDYLINNNNFDAWLSHKKAYQKERESIIIESNKIWANT
ncbi:hypothetical protein LA364_06975 [Aeromonas enteropelogenes]|uniref:hypothetical protein n=1 Tax=Aeromonas enteropelogenes TaxID=29489 RepID=UPI001CE38BA2|nr:hypothetical protein [Aeromonas enteropelogenes]UCA12123.1 hypothetical protein LA364_06975 [Aeromonas enteropelogenes]